MRFKPEDAIFTLPRVAADLKLSAEEQKKMADLRHDRKRGLASVYLSDEDADAIGKKAVAYRKETYALLKKGLNARQQEALNDVVGKPFAGSAFGSSYYTATFGLPKPIETPLVILGLSYGEDPALHKELKLSGDQTKQLAERSRKHREEVAALGLAFGRPGEGARKKLDALFGETEKAVKNVLTAGQVKRFKELTIQQTAGGNPSGDQSIPLHAEIVDGLRLADIQREKIFAGEPGEKVLSKEQQEKWAAMKGEPFKGTLRAKRQRLPGRRGIRRTDHVSIVSDLLGEASVQAELRLSDEQRQKIKGLPAKWQEATKDIFLVSGVTYGADDLTKKVAEATKGFDKAVTEILRPRRRSDFARIQLQQNGSLDALLAMNDVAEKLALTEDQKKKAAGISDGASRSKAYSSRKPSFTSMAFDAEGLELLNATQSKIAEVAKNKLAALLTADQKAKLKELLGKPFKGELGSRSSGYVGYPQGRVESSPLDAFAPPA